MDELQTSALFYKFTEGWNNRDRKMAVWIQGKEKDTLCAYMNRKCCRIHTGYSSERQTDGYPMAKGRRGRQRLPGCSDVSTTAYKAGRTA